MYKPNRLIKSLKHQDIECNQSLNVLCWNTAKLTLKSSYHDTLNSIVSENAIDLFLLQEVKKELARELDIYDYSYVLSPNIETNKHVFGVMNAFKISCEEEMSLLTKKRELAYITRKVTLITGHKISDGRKLLIVNIHAINFVSNAAFHSELESIMSNIKSHKGPMIVAGDFNTWNVKRVEMLKEFIEELSLKEVSFGKESKVKKVFSNCLDYIFYRELKLVDSKVIDTKKISDHNPIIASFDLVKNSIS